MSVLFVEYPKCGTCRKAKKWLEDNKVEFIDRHIAENSPTKDELMEWQGRSGLPLKKFFNTSGMIYRDMGLKDKIPTMPEDEQFELLASNGMLVKRPIVVGKDFVLVGFKETDWEKMMKKS